MALSGVVTQVASADALSDKKETGFGGSYDFGVAKVFANVLTSKLDAAGEVTKRAHSVGAIVPVSAAGSVRVGYAGNSVGGTDADTTSYTVAYLHSLSKRTTAYAGYQNVKNEANATVATAATSSVAGGSSTAIVAGVNHSF